MIGLNYISGCFFLIDTQLLKFDVITFLSLFLNLGRNGSNTRGYFTWSFLDLFEMLDDYESRYGLYFVDLDDPDIKRQPKLSAH